MRRVIKIGIILIIGLLSLKTKVLADSIVKTNFDDITAKNVMLVETKTRKILYERDIDEKIYPASITKLMTAILTVENCELDEIATVSENAVISVPSGYVNANLQVGEELTVRDLLYALLLPSANDAANVLAEHVGGSIESFASMMNSKAKELGCTGTNFTNPSGLHEKTHYTTTRDIYYIAREAISKDIIKKIIGTTTYKLPKTNKYNGTTRILSTTNYMKKKELSNYYCDYCIGGKTGYTGEAKNCVVEFCEKDGIELIAIIMGENAKVKGKKFLDAKELLEYTYNNYKCYKAATKNEKYETVNIRNATKDTKVLDVIYKNNVNILVEKNAYNLKDSITKNVEYYNLRAPIKKGDVIGKIDYEYEGIKYSTELVANQDVKRSGMLQLILYILLIVLIIYIIHLVSKSNRKANKKRKCKKLYK